MRAALFTLLMVFSSLVASDDIVVTWDSPGMVVDGFKLAHNLDGIEVGSHLLDGDVREHIFQQVSKGIHVFRIVSLLGDLTSTPPSVASLLLTDDLTIRVEIR